MANTKISNFESLLGIDLQTIDLIPIVDSDVNNDGNSTDKATKSITIGELKKGIGITVNVKDFGAVGDGVTDDTGAFTAASLASFRVFVPVGNYNLTTDPSYTYETTVWELDAGVSFSGSGKLNGSVINIGKNHSGQWPQNISSVNTGIFDYLETEATLSVLADRGLAISGLVRTSQGTAAAGDAHIGVSAFSYNDYVGGDTGAWGMYSTNVRNAGANGPTQGMEIDVANQGDLRQIYPNYLSPTGLTAGLWVGVGGEITNEEGDTTNTASCAMGIIRNDAKNRSSVNFDKGIVFGSTAIAGTTGTSGSGTAIAFGSCHFMNWYNNDNLGVGAIGCNVQNPALGQTIQISDLGIVFTSLNESTIQFQVPVVASSANWMAIQAATATNAPSISAQGTDTDIDLALYTKGAGSLKFGTYTAGALTPTGYITIKDANNNVRRLLVG